MMSGARVSVSDVPARPKPRTVRSGEDSDGPFVAISLATGSLSAAEVLIDPADADWAVGFYWNLARDGYAYRKRSWSETEGSGSGSVAMHRELLGLRYGDRRQCDHRNRNKLDNRRANLRIVTDGENKQNAAPRRDKIQSRHRGVSLYLNGKFPGCKWRARVQVAGKVKCGYFPTEDEAAEAAAEWRRELMPYSEI